MLYRFIILNGPRKGEQSTLPVDALLIGRGEDCGLILDDEEAAAHHARVTETEHGPHISDLGSMNRILVNKRVVREATLKHGDVVEIGRTQLLLQAFLQAEVLDEGPVVHAPSTRPAIRALAWSAILLGIWVVGQQYQALDEEAVRPSPVAPEAREIPQTPEPPDPAMSDELRRLREELAAIKEAVNGTAAPPPAPAPAPEVPPPRDWSVEIGLARADIAENRLDEAVRRLEAIVAEDPDALDARAEFARLLERRGDYEQAIGQWAKLLQQRGAPDTLAGEAVDAWRRLTEARQEEAERDRAPRLRIAGLRQRRFPESAEYDEMRLVEIELSGISDDLPDPAKMRVEVFFFDLNSQTDQAQPTRATHPLQTLVPRGEWSHDRGMRLTTAYVVPRGRRAEMPAEAYLGFVVRVFCSDRLQDETARPLELLGHPLNRPAGEAAP